MVPGTKSGQDGSFSNFGAWHLFVAPFSFSGEVAGDDAAAAKRGGEELGDGSDFCETDGVLAAVLFGCMAKIS
jgi:hypothetical protein